MKDHFTQQQAEVARQRQMVESEYQRLGLDRSMFEAEKQMEEVRIKEAQRQIEEEKKKLEEMRK